MYIVNFVIFIIASVLSIIFALKKEFNYCFMYIGVALANLPFATAFLII